VGFPVSYVVAPFEVSSSLLVGPVKCRFVHLNSAIAVRHSDTVDCIFQVDGRKVTVAISGAAIYELQTREGKTLTDQQLAEIAALFLRRTLEGGYDPTLAELTVDGNRLKSLARDLGYF